MKRLILLVTASLASVLAFASAASAAPSPLPLPYHAPAAQGSLAGLSIVTQSQSCVTLSGNGFAADAPVNFGTYPADTYTNPTALGLATADGTGAVSLYTCFPASVHGIQYVVAYGQNPKAKPHTDASQTRVMNFRSR